MLVTCTSIVFLFDPLSFFLFGTQFPGLYVASSQRFLPRVFSSRWVDPLSSPASACDVTRCVVATFVAPVGCYLNGDPFPRCIS